MRSSFRADRAITYRDRTSPINHLPFSRPIRPKSSQSTHTQFLTPQTAKNIQIIVDFDHENLSKSTV
ncbi:unnamed protein product, partial [Mesorhabditis belari]|uniref:Uncharacterized protein n=1 Tax=Mesorhabditis belari TaxID=2138241 RepID=A0AAF3EEE4_9BILA